VQKRSRPEPKSYIGRGKIKVLRELIEESPVDAVIIAGEAKPSHHYNIENDLKKDCVDRVRLILEIFSSRANSKESKLQVEKARLRYEMPLLKEWIHNAKSGEHPGFMGGGEYAIDIYYDLIKKRIKAIDDELEEMRKASDQRRMKREKKGFHTVSLAGYTNAGKSSMMRALTGEDVLIEDRMFSTLSTTTRKLKGFNDDVLLIDTIGFLKDLPHFMIESFRNTIEEIFTSDLILLIIDSSEPLEEVRKKLIVSKEVLYPKVDGSKIIIILNKIDISLNKNLIIDISGTIEEIFGNVRVLEASAFSGSGTDAVLDMIREEFRMEEEITIVLPNQEGTQRIISNIYDSCEVSYQNYSEKVHLKARCRSADIGRLIKMIEEAKGTVTITAPAQNDAPMETQGCPPT
jgi:GTP-binding protein HflX